MKSAANIATAVAACAYSTLYEPEEPILLEGFSIQLMLGGHIEQDEFCDRIYRSFEVDVQEWQLWGLVGTQAALLARSRTAAQFAPILTWVTEDQPALGFLPTLNSIEKDAISEASDDEF